MPVIINAFLWNLGEYCTKAIIQPSNLITMNVYKSRNVWMAWVVFLAAAIGMRGGGKHFRVLLIGIGLFTPNPGLPPIEMSAYSR